MARVAGLPSLQAVLQQSIVRAFAFATAPSERRESSGRGVLRRCFWAFCLWPSGPRSVGVTSCGCPPRACISSCPTLPSSAPPSGRRRAVHAMPFGFLLSGVSGSASASWGIRFYNLLRQALSDTLSRQPDRVIDFLPAVLGGSDPRPFLLEPCPRRRPCRARLLSLLSAHWRQHSSAPPPQEFRLYGAHSCKATVLAWARQMSLDRTLRRIQGHHRLSGADRSVELYGRGDIRPMLDLQAQVAKWSTISAPASARCSRLHAVRLSLFRTSLCKFRPHHCQPLDFRLTSLFLPRLPFRLSHLPCRLRPLLRCHLQLLWMTHPRPRVCPRRRWTLHVPRLVAGAHQLVRPPARLFWTLLRASSFLITARTPCTPLVRQTQVTCWLFRTRKMATLSSAPPAAPARRPLNAKHFAAHYRPRLQPASTVLVRQLACTILTRWGGT